MKLQSTNILVTGANRGLGAALLHAFKAAGAAKIYAASRSPMTSNDPALVPIELDVTNPAQVEAAASACGDVDVLVNNAGVLAHAPLLRAPDMSAARFEMETNYFGVLSMCRAFAPILKANGGGTIVNILSTSSWVNNGLYGSYAASKSAAWSLTNGIRVELKAQGTRVVGVHFGNIDTDMIRSIEGHKSDPAIVAQRVLQGIEGGQDEILADDRARVVKTAMANDTSDVYAGFQRSWDKAYEG